jgi:phosphinothricin acetyltransferase
LKIIPCEPRRHSDAILAILNEAIVNSTALYDYQPRSPESMNVWWDGKQRGNFPVIGVEDDTGSLLGFASYGHFRAWPAYKYTVEHSIYVDARARGQGVGRALLGAVVLAAEKQDYHVMVGGIDAANGISIKLHGGFISPPKPLDPRSTQLMNHIIATGRELGLTLTDVPSGGICDGNKIAAAGLPVVDSLSRKR